MLEGAGESQMKPKGVRESKRASGSKPERESQKESQRERARERAKERATERAGKRARERAIGIYLAYSNVVLLLKELKATLFCCQAI